MSHVHTFTDCAGAQRVTSDPADCDYPNLHGDPGEQAQAMFEALFPKGYTPKIDTRTPAQVAAGSPR